MARGGGRGRRAGARVRGAGRNRSQAVKWSEGREVCIHYWWRRGPRELEWQNARGDEKLNVCLGECGGRTGSGGGKRKAMQGRSHSYISLPGVCTW